MIYFIISDGVSYLGRYESGQPFMTLKEDENCVFQTKENAKEYLNFCKEKFFFDTEKLKIFSVELGCIRKPVDE